MKSSIPHGRETAATSGASAPGQWMPRVLVTAGPTHEPIDRVRYIGNRSSGRMGIALALAALRRGWPVTLLLGPVALNPPEHSHLKVQRFQTAADLHLMLQQAWRTHDLLFMAAAVADFTVNAVTAGKLKRGPRRRTLDLVPTPDLVASLHAETRPDQLVVGFALEPASELITEARRKLAEKRLDAIVANPLETMDSADITATLVWADLQSVAAPANISKEAFAEWLLSQVEPALARKRGPLARKPAIGGV